MYPSSSRVAFMFFLIGAARDVVDILVHVEEVSVINTRRVRGNAVAVCLWGMYRKELT